MWTPLSGGRGVPGEAAAGGRLLGLDGREAGDALVLTKPLGTGVLLAADARGLVPAAWMEAAEASMVRDNSSAARCALEFGAHACTDVSGFGLAGHLEEMLSASGVGAVLVREALPVLPGALDLMSRGVRSTFHDQNASRGEDLLAKPGSEDEFEALAFDPQTSGGLLIGAGADRADGLVSALRAAGDESAAIIGRVIELGPSAGNGRSDSLLRFGVAGV